MSRFRLPLILFAGLMILTTTAIAQEVRPKMWFFGSGTGLSRLNAKGDQGFNMGVLGPVEAEVDMDPDDFSDLIDTGFGFGGYVAHEKWLLGYSLGQMTLKDEPSGALPGGGTFRSEFSFETTSFEATVGYLAWMHPKGKVAIRPYVGTRYLKHEVETLLAITGGITASASSATDQNWTDFLIGSSVDVVFSPEWSWATKFDVGLGGSDGTFRVSTGIQWRFWKYMSAGPNFNFMAVDFENGSKGDPDWYLYDVNEYGGGVSFLFHFSR